MFQSESKRWNKRYSSMEKVKSTHTLLMDNNHLIPKQGTALDLACGEGQNADYLQKLGLNVIALDFSIIALRKARNRNPDILPVLIDLEKYQIPQNRFDVIINFYYLNRQLFPQIIKGLRPSGILFFETFTKEMHRIKPDIRRKHLLENNELEEAFLSLDILLYEEIRLEKNKNKVKYIARLIAKKNE